MLDFLKSRRGLAASAAVVILFIIAFFLVTAPNWRSLLKQGSRQSASSTSPQPLSQPSADASKSKAGRAATDTSATRSPPVSSGSSPQAPAPVAAPAPDSPGTRQAEGTGGAANAPAASPGAPGSPAAGTAGANQPAAAAGQPADAAGRTPSFDIVRVEPTGESVIAARGAPNAEIVLLDGGTPIARAKADASGQVALIPPALKPGEHSLVLSMTTPGGDVVSSQSVAVSVSDQPRTAPMVALIQPNKPAAVLSGPVAGSLAKAPSTGASQRQTTPTPGAPVAIRSVEVESLGSFYANGKATPGTTSRVYLNGAFVAAVTADASGNWSLQINKGMKAGRYAVRVDQVDAAGKVTARAEVPFDYPTQVASAAPRTELAKKNTAGAGSSAAITTGSAASVGSRTDQPSGRMKAGDTASPTAGSASSAAAQPATAAASSSGSSGALIKPSAETQTAGASSNVSGAGAAGSGAASKPLPLLAQTTASQSTSVAEQTTGAAGQSKTAGAAKTLEALVVQPDPGRLPSRKAPPGGAAGAAPSAGQEPQTADDATAPTVVLELVTAKVTRGDSLWRISRQMLGHGVRYTQIYAANTQQIRDPRLIYPGQIFVMPTE